MRKGATWVSKNQYNAPAMEVVEFGKEDIVCVISGWGVNGKPGEPGNAGGGGIIEENPDNSIPDTDF